VAPRNSLSEEGDDATLASTHPTRIGRLLSTDVLVRPDALGRCWIRPEPLDPPRQ